MPPCRNNAFCDGELFFPGAAWHPCHPLPQQGQLGALARNELADALLRNAEAKVPFCFEPRIAGSVRVSAEATPGWYPVTMLY